MGQPPAQGRAAGSSYLAGAEGTSRLPAALAGSISHPTLDWANIPKSSQILPTTKSMTPTWRSLSKKVLPPVLRRLARRTYEFAWFRGHFGSWGEELAACRSDDDVA